MVGQNGKQRIKLGPSWLGGQGERQERRKVMDFREREARFRQTCFQVLLGALLGMEAERIMPAGFARAEEKQDDVVIAFGLQHPFSRYRQHGAPAPCPLLP